MPRHRPHYTAAQKVAIEGFIRVGGIVNPAQAEPLCLGFEGDPRNVEQGTLEPPALPLAQPGHGRQATRAAAAQGGEQEGLGLIVAVLGQPQRLARHHTAGESRVARLPRRAFEPQPGVTLDLHALNEERYPEGRAEPPAVELETVGGDLQAMVNVQCI